MAAPLCVWIEPVLIAARLRLMEQQSEVESPRHAGRLGRAGEIIVDWWDGAVLSNSGFAAPRFFMEAAQTLPLLIKAPATADLLDAMQVHRIRLAKEQGMRAWEPPCRKGASDVVLAAARQI